MPINKLTIILLFIVITLQGCIRVNPVGPLNPTTDFVESPINRTAMIDTVVVTDKLVRPAIRSKAGVALTSEIKKYVDQAGYFTKVTNNTTRMYPNDVKLQFEFQELRVTRKIPPHYMAGAILTATIWIWVGGPLYTDEVNLAARLKVLDSNGVVIASSEKVIKTKSNVNFYHEDYEIGLLKRTDHPFLPWQEDPVQKDARASIGRRHLEEIIKSTLDDVYTTISALPSEKF